MRRRDFVTLLGGVATAWPLIGRAQSERARKIGVIMSFSEDDARGQRQAALFRQALNALGWTDGRNVQLDYRYISGDAVRAKSAAAELVSEKPDVIVANSSLALAAVHKETTAIPIVFVVVGDPVGQGFVTSLAHPGGNITGFTAFEFAISGKWLELIKEVAPELGRVGFIFSPDAGPYAQKFVQSITPMASSLGVNLMVIPTHDVTELDRAVAAIASEPKGGLIVSPDSFTVANRSLIISLAGRYRLPAIYAYRYYATEGGLMSYGHDVDEPWQRAPAYVDKILKGASPADLPIQQPTKFELVINLKTAKALGLTIPPQLLDRANELVE
jgi:putative tryptophan/tyrosine transport system substrate-binding protein